MSTLRDNHIPLDAALIARKLDRLRNFECRELLAEIEEEPRLAEALWFLHYVSNPDNFAGGLRQVARELLARSPGCIGTPTMRELADQQVFTNEQVARIYAELPDYVRQEVGGDDYWLYDTALLDPDDIGVALTQSGLDAKAGQIPVQVSAIRERLTRGFFVDLCQRQPDTDLANYLVSVCEMTTVGFRPWRCPPGQKRWKLTSTGAPWFFSGVAEALLDFMDEQRHRWEVRLGKNVITRLIFKWLNKAQSMGRTVFISGNSRYGKTEAAQCWCRMHPGRARFVETPPGDSERNFLTAVADALCIDTNRVSSPLLRERIAYVLKHSRMMLAFDEAQFILPQSLTPDSNPVRLNWLRRAVMDKGTGVALLATPQSYRKAKKRFVDRTKFAIEQFDGRILKVIHLPDELSGDDLLAVAQALFPDLPSDYLDYLVESVLAVERNYVSDLEKIATLSRDNAREAGRLRPVLDDIKSAMAEVFPSLPSSQPPSKTPGSRSGVMDKSRRRIKMEPMDLFPPRQSNDSTGADKPVTEAVAKTL